MPTPTLDVRRRFAWENYDCNPDDGGCTRKTGRRCVDANGDTRHPHPCRIRRADDYFAGQASKQTELDALSRDRDSLHFALEAAEVAREDALQAVAHAQHQAQDLTEQLRVARAGAALVPGLQQRIEDLTAERNALATKVAIAEQRIANLQSDLADEQAAHQNTRETAAHVIADLRAQLEALNPPTSGRLPFGIGMDEKAATSAFPKLFTHTQIEAQAGATLGYLHEYFRFGTTGVLTSAITWCETQLKAGRVPIATFKLPGDDWAGAAAGKYDGTIKATMDALEALAAEYKSRVVVAVHHEPNNGDGPLAAFLAMTRHLLPIVKRPGLVEYWINLTGYAQLYQDTEWTLDACYIEGIDGYAFNPYLSLGASSSKLTSQRTGYYEKFAAWAKTKGVQWGIWETGINETAAAMTTIPGVKTWIVDNATAAAELGATMWVYWNNRVSAEKHDWRISTTAPANKIGQMVATVKKYALP